MSFPLTPEHLMQLNMFVVACIANPLLLHEPELAFVKNMIERFGGKVPEPKATESPNKAENAKETKESEPEPELEPEVESEESDVELDMTGVIEPDTDAPQEMGNVTSEPTEEEIEESEAQRSEAAAAFMAKDFEKAMGLYTEAIVLNPQAPLLYAKRAQLYLLLQKPNACIRDCNRALELNPDSAAAHKFRGRAYQLLGKFKESANDLRLACKFDFDEQADEWLREVTPNARKLEEHKRKMDRKILEKLVHEKANAGAFAKWDPHNILKVIKDLGADQYIDPEIKQAIQDMSSNPLNILKYQNNPKIMGFFDNMTAKFNNFMPKSQDDIGLD